MSSALAQSYIKQVKTERKANHFFKRMDTITERRKDMDLWMKQFDEFISKMNKSEYNDNGDLDEIRDEREKEFTMKLNIKEHQPCHFELGYDKNDKPILKGRKEFKSGSEVQYEEFSEILDLPENISIERITLTEDNNGYLTIKAPLLRNKQKRNVKWTYNPIDGFSVKLNVMGFTPEDVELVVDTEGKLIVKGKRQIKTEDDTYDEEFNEILDLPKNIDEEEICLTQDECGYLVIAAPTLRKRQLCNLNGRRIDMLNAASTVSDSMFGSSNRWNQLFDELFAPMVTSVHRKC